MRRDIGRGVATLSAWDPPGALTLAVAAPIIPHNLALSLFYLARIDCIERLSDGTFWIHRLWRLPDLCGFAICQELGTITPLDPRSIKRAINEAFDFKSGMGGAWH